MSVDLLLLTDRNFCLFEIVKNNRNVVYVLQTLLFVISGEETTVLFRD